MMVIYIIFGLLFIGLGVWSIMIQDYDDFEDRIKCWVTGIMSILIGIVMIICNFIK